MKILIVEDDDVLLSFLTRELVARDCEVVPTHFGDGGLSLYKKDGPFELVLSDFYFIPGSEIKKWGGIGERDPRDQFCAAHGVDDGALQGGARETARGLALSPAATEAV